MDKYVETLDALMKAKKEKKKKEPTIKEKEAFRSAWLSLVADTGLVGRAEQFLYEGFAFCGAEPFYAYLIQTEDQNATLATMFSGKYYGIDSNVSFRLVTHLLALMLNNNAPRNILAPIIKRLPGACVNKDKNDSARLRKHWRSISWRNCDRMRNYVLLQILEPNRYSLTSL